MINFALTMLLKTSREIADEISALVRRTPPSVMLELLAGQPHNSLSEILREIVLAEMAEVYPEYMALRAGRQTS